MRKGGPTPMSVQRGHSRDAIGETDSTRRPHGVYSVGEDPDVRFSFANERTALAWMRTALALIAGGLALLTLTALTNASALYDVLAIVLCAAGGLLSLGALLAWMRNERAMRLNQPLPPPIMLVVVVAGTIAFAVALVVVAVVTAVH